MYEEILFHGTEIERGKRILKQKYMIYSSGDKHWLGDGSYFYEDDFYAYKWIKDMYIGKFGKEPDPPKNIFYRYKIVKGKVEAEKNRVFDLDNPRRKMEFDRVHENCKQIQKYSEKLAKQEFSEGVILNIMFNNMFYSKDYDIVIATFKRRGNKYSNESMRLNYISEKQICVKNLKKVLPIGFYECNDKIIEFENCIDNLEKVKEIDQFRINEKVLTYNINRDRKVY